jgi:murein DD-endopeptidase MepM/ murein hydrolase activator NlpD
MRLLSLLVLNAIILASPKCDAAECNQDKQVDLRTEKYGQTSTVMLNPPAVLEATIDVDLELKNMSASRPQHFVYCIDGLQHSFRQPVEVVRVWRTNQTQPYSFHWNYNWRNGIPGGHHDNSYVYALPYRSGEKHPVFQGNFGKFSHNRGTPSEYAVDFGMPEGTPVCAARDGIVVASYGDSTVGGNDKKYENCANFISVKHTDGSYGRYVHLQPHGNLAPLGQSVRKGDRIGLSGATGFADRPHLHFAVSITEDGSHDRSVPIIFRTDKGNLSELSQGVSY